MANRILTQGTQFQIGDGATPTEAFAKVDGVTSIGGPNETTEQIESTDFDSTAKEYEFGLDDGGECTVECNHDPDSTTQAAMGTARANKTKKNFRIVYNDATATKTKPSQWAFSALVLGREFGHEINGIVKVTYTLKISGTPVFTARSAS